MNTKYLQHLLKHCTPGDWEINNSICKTSINANKKHVAMVNYFNSIEDHTNVSDLEHDANCQLIALAPQLAHQVIQLERQLSKKISARYEH